jgi:hypothetical protein
MLFNSPIPKDQLLSNLGLYLNSKNLFRIIFFNEIYKKIVNIPGVIMEFGTRWGQNSALFASLRGMYEPFNRHRKIIIFDTFEGFPKISKQDGKSDLMKKGQLSLTKNYHEYSEEIMNIQENDNPINHIKKFEIYKGDAPIQLKKFLKKNPQSIISLAYFDFDLYKPTKDCLSIIKKRLVKGSILGFDELNDPDSPGETTALMEVFDMNKIRLKKLPYVSRVSYFEIE